MLCVLSAGSTLHGLSACAALAAQAIGKPLDIATDHGHNIRDAVLAGTAQADVVLLPEVMVAALSARDLVRDAVAIGSVAIGGVVRTGAAVPSIATMADLHRALAAADAVLLTRAPTGEHLLRVIEQIGLTDSVAPRLHRFDTSQRLLAHLAARGDNALGFSPETEIRAGRGVTWIGHVPDEIQIALPYAAAMLTGTAQPEAARALLSFLATAPARDAFARSGVRSRPC